jgi:hypothetical protein
VVTIDCKPSSNNFITSFIRAQKKSKDHESKFYIGDHFKEHIHNHLSEFFSSDMALDREVLQNISNSDSKKDKEIVSKKRWQQLLAEPELLLPYVSVIDEKRIKINFPNEPWVDFLRENFAKLGLSCFDLCYDFNEIKSKTSSFFNKLTILMYSNLEKNKGNWLKLIKNDQAVKLKADFSIKMLDHLQDFLKNHDSFSEGLALSFIVNLNFSIQETLDFFRFCKNLPRETLGEIESRIPQLLRELSGKANANDDDSLVVFLRLKDYKGMLKFLDENKFKRISKDFLIKPLLLPFTKNISEITTESGLMAEGSTMKHCVGGFGNKVKRSECRIFHIESKGSLSTLEIEIHEAKIIFPKKKECKIKKGCTVDQAVKSKRSKFRTIKVFVIRQHRSKYNGRPSSVNLKIAEKLVMYLNQTIQYYPAIKATGDIVSKKDLIAKN